MNRICMSGRASHMQYGHRFIPLNNALNVDSILQLYRFSHLVNNQKTVDMTIISCSRFILMAVELVSLHFTHTKLTAISSGGFRCNAKFTTFAGYLHHFHSILMNKWSRLIFIRVTYTKLNRKIHTLNSSSLTS